jgi:hypothetical protein
VLRSGARRRGARAAAVVTSLVLFVGFVAWTAIVVRDRPQPASVGSLARYGSLAVNGWTMQYPKGWHITPVTDCGIGDYHGGFVVSNTVFTFRNPKGGPPGCEDRLLLGGFPSDGVALVLSQSGGGGLYRGPPKNTVFPMTLERRGSPAWPGGPNETYERITIDREPVADLRSYVEVDASPADRVALADIVWSLRYRSTLLSMRFPPAEGWRTWTYVNQGPNDEQASTASATNARHAGAGRPPSLFGSGLPADRIQITAWLVGEDRPATPNPNFPPTGLPLRVPQQLEDHWEGYPDPAGALRRGRVWAEVNGRDLIVWVLFGSDPTQEMRDAAQAELDGLFVPANVATASP